MWMGSGSLLHYVTSRIRSSWYLKRKGGSIMALFSFVFLVVSFLSRLFVLLVFLAGHSLGAGRVRCFPTCIHSLSSLCNKVSSFSKGMVNGTLFLGKKGG